MGINCHPARMSETANHFEDAAAATELLERQWFAASAAAKNLQAECDVLLGVLELAADSWRQSCARLAQLEALRYSLGERLAAASDAPQFACPATTSRFEVISAA